MNAALTIAILSSVNCGIDIHIVETYHPRRLAIPSLFGDQSTLVTVREMLIPRYAVTNTACPTEVKKGTRWVSTWRTPLENRQRGSQAEGRMMFTLQQKLELSSV